MYIILNYKSYFNFYLDSNYDYANVFAFLQNCYTPKLIELNLNNVGRYFNSLFLDANFYTLAFIWIPVGVALYFVIVSFIKNRFNIVLFSIGVLYIIMRVFLQILFGIQFEVGEYILVVPLMLIIMSYGIEKNYLSVFLFVLFILSNFYYLFTQDNSAMKNNRYGVLAIADIVNMYAKDGDTVVSWVDISDFDKTVYRKINLRNVYDEYIKNSAEIVNNKAALKRMNSKERKDFHRKYFLNVLYSRDIVSKTNILMGIVKPGTSVLFVYPKKYDVGFYEFLDIVSKDYLYYKYTENDLFLMQAISQIKNILVDSYVRKTEKDNMVVTIYKK